MRSIRISGVIAAALTAAMLLGTGPAQAGISCKYIPSMCPAQVDPPKQTGVPEPATLALLTTGFAAAGLSAWRRRKSKN